MTDLKRNPRPKDLTFTRYWEILVPRLEEQNKVTKENLLKLKVLCDLYSEYEDLKTIIKVAGYTVDNGGGRNGTFERLRPEVTQKNKVVDQIKAYTFDIFGKVLFAETEEENEFD
jgi:phage terminase small subunit